MSCNRQLDLGSVALERQGLLDDPGYIARAGESRLPVNPNVAPLSVNAAASILAQYVSFSVAPAGLGDPGPLQYTFSTHYFEHRNDATSPHCATEAAEGAAIVVSASQAATTTQNGNDNSQRRWDPAFAFSAGSTIEFWR